MEEKHHSKHDPILSGFEREEIQKKDLIRKVVEHSKPRTLKHSFLQELFGEVNAVDLITFDSQSLRGIGDEAFAVLSKSRQKGGQATIHAETRTCLLSGKVSNCTVLYVVNNNRIYLVDSTLAALNDLQLYPCLVAHPIYKVDRDPYGRLLDCQALNPETPSNPGQEESLICIALESVDNNIKLDALIERLTTAYADLTSAIEDQTQVHNYIQHTITHYQNAYQAQPTTTLKETLCFLEWIMEGNFIALGLKAYPLPECSSFSPKSYGLLKGEGALMLRVNNQYVETTDEIEAFLNSEEYLFITKSSKRSRVYRALHLDYIVIKLLTNDGTLAGHLRVIGLFNSEIYTLPAHTIPYIRKKVQAAEFNVRLNTQSYAGRSMHNVLETYPRDELFQIEVERLILFALTIKGLEKCPRVRVLVRPDRFKRYASLLVYIPKSRFRTELIDTIGESLANAYKGRLSSSYPSYPEGMMVRVHYIIAFDEHNDLNPNEELLEALVNSVLQTWSDRLQNVLISAHPKRIARTLFQRYGSAFSASYQEAFSVEEACNDIGLFEKITEQGTFKLKAENHDGKLKIRLKVYAKQQEISLTRRVPVLEHLGFEVVNERVYCIKAANGQTFWLYAMSLDLSKEMNPAEFALHKERIEEGLVAIFSGLCESDHLNKLMLLEALNWKEVSLLRAFSRYLRQVGLRYEQYYIASVLTHHTRISKLVIDLFHAKFNPETPTDREDIYADLLKRFEHCISEVENLDEDQVFRRTVNLVESCLRTNYYQSKNQELSENSIAFKFNASLVMELPAPRPLREVFVYSPRVEGVHLRFGLVARGGIRWSDRPEDYRTEILGLAKAQNVKNAVIVPLGAKGGFVLKQSAYRTDRNALQTEAVRCYTIFITALLSITDNIVDGHVVHPDSVLCYDGDDPYFVVAADKGTATFSDIANSLASERHYWLDDAFASGGSNGYDHKVMGITAKGAWETTRCHFQEMDLDVQKDPIRVVGVGDMSGDVFGNGTLLSKTIKLIAAFDHRDIFIDPNPDPNAAFKERKRLFQLPRSSWQDYSSHVLSKGGAIYARSLKRITLSREACEALDLESATLSPNALIQAILKAPVDLIWFGGIGTYVCSSQETNAMVGDKSNDPVRIHANLIRAKAIGEGANLALTQRGRVEASLNGVRLNTDAIDNSAGVNTSDIEVNIKIALMKPLHSGQLTQEERNALLSKMTDDVERLVLKNNQLQALALSLAERDATQDALDALSTMQTLEKRKILDRKVHNLPDDQTMVDRMRANGGLTRPEYAILLACTKLDLYNALIMNSAIDTPYFQRILKGYFPSYLVERFPEAVEQHQLKREIISTALSNQVVNRIGITTLSRLSHQTGADLVRITLAYILSSEVFAFEELYSAVDSLAFQISGSKQLELYHEIQTYLIETMTWFIRNTSLSGALDVEIELFRKDLNRVKQQEIESFHNDDREHDFKRLESYHILAQHKKGALLKRFALLPYHVSILDIIMLTKRAKSPLGSTVQAYFISLNLLNLTSLTSNAKQLHLRDSYDSLALNGALSRIAQAHHNLCMWCIAHKVTTQEALMTMTEVPEHPLKALKSALDQFWQSGTLTLSKIIVIADILSDKVRYLHYDHEYPQD